MLIGLVQGNKDESLLSKAWPGIIRRNERLMVDPPGSRLPVCAGSDPSAERSSSGTAKEDLPAKSASSNQSNVYQRLHRAGPKWTRRLSFTVPVPTPRQQYRQLETTPGTDNTPHLQLILLQQWKPSRIFWSQVGSTNSTGIFSWQSLKTKKFF
jgi:hypothetical protein